MGLPFFPIISDLILQDLEVQSSSFTNKHHIITLINLMHYLSI